MDQVFDTIVTKVKELRPSSTLDQSFVDSTLVRFLNLPQIIGVIKEWQRYTTIPTWYDALAPLVNPEPDHWLDHQRNLKFIGLKKSFIDLLSYQDYRPKTDMNQLLGIYLVRPNFYTFEAYEAIKNEIDFENPRMLNVNYGEYTDLLIKVNRYQSKNSGKYYSADLGKDYCGYYYYFETRSPYVLKTGRTLVTYNKIALALHLGILPHQIIELLQPYYSDEAAISLEEYIKQMLAKNYALEYDPLFYAVEDELDQFICRRARVAKYDVVILRNMTGRSGFVTELLDTRTPRDSVRSLFFPPMPTSIDYSVNVDQSVYFPLKTIEAAVQEYNNPEIRSFVTRVIVGKFELDYKFNLTGHVTHERLFEGERIEIITGGLAIETATDFAYALRRKFTGNVSIFLTRAFIELLNNLGDLGTRLFKSFQFGDTKSYQIVFEFSDGPELLTYYGNKIFYGGQSFLPAPQSIETLIIDRNGINPNITLAPQHIVLEKDGYKFLRTIFERFPGSGIRTIVGPDNFEDDVITEDMLPTYVYPTMEEFLAVEINMIEPVLKIFPKLKALRVYAIKSELAAIKSSVKLISVYSESFI